MAAARKPMNRARIKRQIPLHLMLIVPVILTIIFAYGPMAGLILAFQDFLPGQGFYIFGSKFVGLYHFQELFSQPKIWSVIGNTALIAVLKMIFGLIATVGLAILLNEINSKPFKKGVQTVIFLPHFISWVIMASMITSMISTDNGVLTNMLAGIGITIPDFLGEPSLFPGMLVLTHLWKEAGWGAIVYLAAITMIDPNLYEAARIDGAGRLKSVWHITLPGMLSIIILMSVLNMGNILNAGFEQIVNLYNTNVYSTGDILDTYVYRIAIKEGSNVSMGTAVNLLKSGVSFVFVAVSYVTAYKFFDYRIF
jgi:putative aldouronate transport system permease protein